MPLYLRGLGIPLRAWVWLTLGMLLYGGVVATLLIIDLGTAAPADPLLPEWTPLVLSLVLYLVLALAAFARVSLLGVLVATGVLCGLRIVLGIVTAVLDAVLLLTPIITAFVDAFSGVSLLTLLGLASPPFLLAPLGRIRPRSRWVRARARARQAQAGYEAVPADARKAEEKRGSTVIRSAVERLAPAAPLRSTPPESRPPAPSRPLPERRPPPPPMPVSPPPPVVPVVEAEPPAPAVAIPPISSPVAVIRTPSVAPPAAVSPAAAISLPGPAVPAPTTSAPLVARPNRDEPAEFRPAPRHEASAAGDGVVRVSFARVASQLPADALRLPAERIAADLPEAGYVSIPIGLVAPQLSEGLVQIAWPVVAAQLPRQALALSDTEMVRRLPNGAVVLPLDEVVRQMPVDHFALPSRPTGIPGIEDFPPPFQPHVSSPEAEPAPRSAAAPVVPPAPKPVVRPAAKSAPPPASAPSSAPTPMVSAPPSASAPPAPPEPAAPSVVTVSSAPAPTGADLTIVRSGMEHAAALQRLTSLMGDLRAPLDVGIREADGMTLFTVVPAGLSEEAIAATATRVLPCLNSQLADSLEQVTARSAETVLVLTPLGSRPPHDALLAAALPVGAPLALLEQQALRAVSSLPRPASSGRTTASVAPRVDLHDAPVPPHVRAIADSLRTFGSLSATVLRDCARGSSVYVFLPPRDEPRALAELASQFHTALSDAEIGPPISIVLRLRGQRVVVRALDGGRGALLVAATSGERPGRVRLEVERAASRLVERGA